MPKTKGKRNSNMVGRNDDETDVPTSRTEVNQLEIFNIKWKKIMEDEERDIMVLQTRETILDGALETCYDNYLKNQAIDFTVHCAYLAWIKIIDWYFLKHDPGEVPDDPLWAPDKEPEPSPMEAWFTRSVPIKIASPPEEITEETPTLEILKSSETTAEQSEAKSSSSEQLYKKHVVSTEWGPDMVESVLREVEGSRRARDSSADAIKETKPEPERKLKPEKKRLSEKGAVRRSHVTSSQALVEGDSAGSSTLQLPPIMAPNTLPPKSVDVKYTVVPLETELTRTYSVRNEPSATRQVHWRESVRSVANLARVKSKNLKK